MNIELNTQVGALFKLVAHKGDGVPTRETGWFHNLVLDTGLARMSVGTWIDRCCVGTGNSTPAVTQTALDAFKASTTTRNEFLSSIQTTTTPFYISGVVRWRFGEGVAAGNISEVGMGWGNSSLWNRALVKDNSGNPTTITVLSDEYLDVISEVRVYPVQSYSGSLNLLDKTGAVVSTHTVTGLPYFYTQNATPNFNKIEIYNDYTGLYVATGVMNSSVTANPSGEISNATSVTVATSYPTTTSQRATFTIPLTAYNATHQSFRIRVYGLVEPTAVSGYKFQISPTITKTSSQVMTYTFTVSWGRYTP